jgi:hypothetical protein
MDAIVRRARPGDGQAMSGVFDPGGPCGLDALSAAEGLGSSGR